MHVLYRYTIGHKPGYSGLLLVKKPCSRLFDAIFL
jgi:hypothetical protein